jgi:hypothetical protein
MKAFVYGARLGASTRVSPPHPTLVGFGTEFVGMLLWPAAALHAALTALLAYPLIETR